MTGGTHTLFGEAGQRHVLCRFVGLVGNATMDGGTGNDSFFGGRGSDFMFGAGSADTFVFHAADLMLVTRTLQRALGLAK